MHYRWSFSHTPRWRALTTDSVDKGHRPRTITAAASTHQLKEGALQHGASNSETQHLGTASKKGTPIANPAYGNGLSPTSAAYGREVVFNQPGTHSPNRSGPRGATNGTGQELEGSLTRTNLQS